MNVIKDNKVTSVLIGMWLLAVIIWLLALTATLTPTFENQGLIMTKTVIGSNMLWDGNSLIVDDDGDIYNVLNSEFKGNDVVSIYWTNTILGIDVYTTDTRYYITNMHYFKMNPPMF